MADDLVHKQEFLTCNLPTRHVTLYPTKVQIAIYGITPTAEESSIKVDGRGAATITDMMVDLVPNKQAYEDAYSESEEDDVDSSSYPDGSESNVKNEETNAISGQITHIDEEIKQVREEQRSALGQLYILERYKNTVEEKPSDDLPKFIQIYREERRKAFSFYKDSESRMNMKTEQRSKVVERQLKAFKALRKERAKLNKEKKLEAERKARARKEKLDTKRRLKEERSLFWAKKVYRVVISLEASVETPASSRRGSVESLSTLRQEPISADAAYQISLSVSYVSSSASWAPRYDLSLNTSTAAGVIIDRAEYYNATSETWKDTKVSLSTSKAAFQGLHEPRSALFGLTNVNEPYPDPYPQFQKRGFAPPLTAQQQQLTQQQQQQVQQQMLPRCHKAFQRATRGMRLTLTRTADSQSRGLKKSANYTPRELSDEDECADKVTGDPIEFELHSSGSDTYKATSLPSLATEEATWAEEGLSFTYDIGVRTITPSFTKRRHRIVSVQLKKVSFSYLLVPKLQAAAFLKARIQNSSSISLLRGMAGVTLNGSFLGNTMLPQCSAGDSFSLSLGVDPSVNVTYSKPEMRRNKESGLFFAQKEDSCVFTRTCTIMNTKANRIIEGAMLDQVPISQDERLKVWIQQPCDINAAGVSGDTGEGITRDGRKESKWGKAIATNRARGEVRWDLKIESLRGGKLILEYETRYPGGDCVIGAGDGER